MDNVTLNGFEVFEDLMPGASVKNKPITPPTNEEEEETKIDLEGVGEELSEEELNNIRKNTCWRSCIYSCFRGNILSKFSYEIYYLFIFY